MRLQDKVALVTGGGSGIGAAICERFAEEGAKVIVSDINLDAAEATGRSIAESGHRAECVKLDATDEAEWISAIESIVRDYGRLDVVVNNAGIVIPGNVEETTVEDWDLTQQVNSRGVFLGLREAIKAMKTTGGDIINISSIEGIIAEPQAAAYCASKGSVRSLTKSAALHCASQGYDIRVNSVHPGFIETPMVENAIGAMPEEERAGFTERIIGAIPFGKMGTPLDIANGCLFLASDESNYMTGSELVIDGGYTAQ